MASAQSRRRVDNWFGWGAWLGVLVCLGRWVGPAAAASAAAADDVIYANDFSDGLGDFVIEQERPATVTAGNGVLTLDTPAGLTVWLKRRLEGPVSIEYDATAVSNGGANDRVSDLNCFWMADNAHRGGEMLKTPRSGAFAEYDTLACYYVGYGGNANSTTRFRRYVGEKNNRPLRPGDEYTDAPHLLRPNVRVHVKLVADGGRIEYWRDGERLFSMDDPQPYRDGYFGFRTVKSHLEIRNLIVRRLPTANAATRPAASPVTLRQAAGDRLLIGAAVRPDQLRPSPVADLIAAEFSCLTAENVFKPLDVHPEPGRFTFEKADAVADFAAAHGQKLIGHTLVWHTQAPKWLFEGVDGKPLSRDAALANLKTHIDGVAGHFKGRVLGWDVVNEALDDSEKRYWRDTPALRAIGDDYVIQAFKFAHAADPSAELYYNDYSNEHDPKLAKTVRLVKDLKAAGCRIDAVGLQGHWQMDWPPPEQIEKAIIELAALGVKVNVTELDIDVLPRRGRSADVADTERGAANPYADGKLPDAVATKQAERYAAIFAVLRKHSDKVSRVTFWGVDDGMRWLNDYPTRGRTNFPLLFDRQLRPKAAHASVVEVLRGR